MAAILAFAQSASFATKPRASSRSHEPTQSLTYHNIIAHLKSAGLRATEVQKRCTVFFEGEWKDANRYDYCLIIVENSDEDVQVTFYLTDAHEMNWITEFLDASYFTSAETQKLFGIVNAHASTQVAKVGRYRVESHHWQPKHAQIFVFSFTPA